MAEATSEKLVGTIGIRVSETTDRELDTLIEKLEDVNSVADTLVKKTLTLDIKTDTIESKISSVSKGLNKELREQLVGGFRVAMDEMKASLKEADVSFQVSFDVAEFSAQLTQAVTAAASTFSTSIANDLQAAVAQLQQSGAASITVTPQTGSINHGGQAGGGRASGTGNRELARIYSQITASIREEYRLMTQMLRLEGDAYQSAENRLQVVRDQVGAYREMIQQAAEAGQTDPVRAANLDSLQASLSSKLDIATSQAEQRSIQQEAAELLRLYTQLLDMTQRIRLAGDDATAGMVLQRQQIRDAYLAQEQVVESYRDTADGAALWADYLQRIEELTGRYAENTETQELVREQEKLNALRLEEVQLAYQAKGGVSEELELVSWKAAAQQAVVDQMASQYGRSEAFLAAQRNGVAQVTRELEKQAQVTAQMRDAESRKSEQALYSFNVSELQQAYKDILSSTTQMWNVQEKMKTATSAELPYLQQIEASLQNRLTLSQNVFSRLKDYPEAIQLQGKLTDELAVKQAEYNLQLLKSRSHADSLAHTLEHMAGNLLSDVVRGFAREVANAFREAAVYVEEYNSLLTEISIVTGRTQAEVEALGGSYRTLAKEMKVTSTQIAEAAVGYYRQGLNDIQVMERLTKTIQFSKTSGLEFADAAEYLTATVNSMDVTIERAADVFNYLGDATATGADEVAVAFSKVGGAAKTADLEFEKVASWIAVVSSRTREAAEVIGSSLNSILARYRNIKEAGFIQDDDGSTTVTNDVVTALGAAGINAIDESSGQLRNYGDILDELAPKWATLDSNTQAYLGTVMAGTRMQSRFFNLMEHYDESLELYNEALESTGTTSQKYAQWSESVAAAHERMNASLEALYANLVSSDALKTYYNLMASLADMLGFAVGELDLWKLSLGLVAAAVVASMSMMRISFRDLNAEMVKTMALRVVDWFKNLISSSSKASLAVRGLGAAFKASLAFLAVSLIISAVQAIASAGDESERAARKIEQMNEALSDISDRRTRLDSIQSELEGLQQKAVLSQTDFTRLVEIKAELAALSPELAAKYEAEGQSMATLSGLVRDAASAYQELSEEERKAKAGARSAYYDQTDDMFYTWGQWGKTDYEKAVINRDDAQWYYDNAVNNYRNYMDQLDWYDADTRAEIEASDYHKQTIADYEILIAEMEQNLSNAQDELDAQLIAINKAYQDGAVTHMKAALDGIEEADARRRELAYQALDNAQAYAEKDDAHTEAMISSYLRGQDSVQPVAFAQFTTSAERYFALLQNGTASYSELQEAADEYGQAAMNAFGLDITGSLQKTVSAMTKQRDAAIGTLTNNREADWAQLMTSAGAYDSVAAMTAVSEGLARTQHDAELSGQAIEDLFAILTDGDPSDTLAQINTWLENLRGQTADVTTEAYAMSEALTKAMESAAKATAAKPLEQMAAEGGYKQLTELSQTGQIAGLNDDMLVELLEMYPELAALIDETTGQLRNDFDSLSPVIEKARLTYAEYLRSTLEAVTQAKSDLAQGVFDPTGYADLIEQMQAEGYDLLSVLGGEDGVAKAQAMLTTFFGLYNNQLEVTAGHVGVVAESWQEAQQKALQATQAEEAGFLAQLESLKAGESVLDWDNMGLVEAFSSAYPEIAACLDETGKFTGSLEELHEVIRKVHFDSFEQAGEKISSLETALEELGKGNMADAVGALPEEYQTQVLPLLNDRLALEQWINEELAVQQTAQRNAWTAMTGGAAGYEAYIRKAVNTTDDLTQAIEQAKEALLDQSFSRMEREGGYSELLNLYNTGKIENFNTDMFERLLTMYPELVSMIDHETGTLTADLSELIPLLNKATLAYASSLRDTLDSITAAKDDMAKGLFDASQYEELIEVMDEYGFDLLSVLGGEEGIEEAMDMMDDFFERYHEHLIETGEHLGIIAEDWDTVQAKQEEARQAAESGYMEQLQHLIDTGSISFDNSAITEGFLSAYPAIAACIDATGKFRGNVGDLRKELGRLSFKKFTAASDDIESLQEALQGIRKGKSAVDVVSGLAESYQEELIPALQNREALEELITQQINDQAIEQQYALWQMQGNTGSFINYCAMAYPQLYNALAQVYGQDVQNFQTFGQAKAAIDAAVRQAIGDSWDGVYASGIAQMDKAAAQLEAAGQSAAASRYRAIANAMRAINNTRVSAGGGIKIPSVSSSGGGGGSSSSSSKQQTAADKMIDRMSNTDDYVDAQRTILQLQQAYHEARNETEAVLHYMQQEYDLIKDLPEQYRQNMKEIKAMLDAKKAELAATSTSADNYETLANDVQNLEAAYSQYQQQMIETETELLELTEAMEEQRNAVRDTTIEVQDLITQAIEDRNAREEEALEARIDMEDEIIAALQKRYEAERDMQKEALDERKAALQEEKQALTDALNDRKQLKEEQSKAEQLALMEANYAVISRDATRAKEAAALYEDIQELRDEIGEDQLSKQIEEQQKLLDEQIAAIEKELAGLDEAYEEHSTPADLAAEVAEILSMTDEQIIEWLKAHSEDFAASTAATQEAMIAGWQETLNAMNGIQETNWAEVEQIMAGGQEAIIQFLRENLDDYRLASKEQAEAYEEEWVKVLDRLKAQMQSFQETATLNPGEVLQPTVIKPSTSSGSSSGSSSSSGGSGGKKNNSTSSTSTTSSLASLLAGAAATISGAIAGATVAGTVGSVIGAATAAIGSAVASTVKSGSSITNAITNLFGGNSSKKTTNTTTNNSVTVNVNASTVKSTANTIKSTIKKNGISMTLK